MRDGYNTAKVELIRDDPIEQHEFDGLLFNSMEIYSLFLIILDLFQLNRNTYNRARNWFDNLDEHRKTLINDQLQGYPQFDDLIQESSNKSLFLRYTISILSY